MFTRKKLWSIALTTVGLLFFFSTWKTVSLPQNMVLRSHSLPLSLQQWQDREAQGDYFDLIAQTPVGYLVWSQFPITVYVEPPVTPLPDSAEAIRLQQWVEAVQKAIAEWNVYLPLQEIKKSEFADIVIERSLVEREFKLNPTTGLYDIPRTVTAQTNYEFSVRERSPKILTHKMMVKISPDLSPLATLAAARHELGHALGIWGHSDRESDALYFSQVRNTPNISARDVNTLKKIYQQPTKLGWSIKE